MADLARQLGNQDVHCSSAKFHAGTLAPDRNHALLKENSARPQQVVMQILLVFTGINALLHDNLA